MPVTQDKFHYLPNGTAAIPLPVPPSLHNEGNYIVSLGEVTRWLAEQAEALGVEVFPGFPASGAYYAISSSLLSSLKHVCCQSC